MYLVRSRLSGERQVIKQIPLSGMTEKQRSDTLNETKIHSQIHHPQIILYHGCFTEDDFLYIQMEYAERGDLMQLIEAHKGNQVRIREDAIWEYLAQICHGLHYLHQKRILHRDIKARNIFLDGDLNVKIGDLGLGRELGPASRFAYTAVGTPLYFSPEMCQEERYNEKCDVWALGCLIYEMSALRPPFNATNQLALAKRICEEEVAPLPQEAGYSKDLQFIISQMLRKDPEKRPSIQQILAYGPVQQRQYEVQLKRERRVSSRLRQEMKEKETSHQRELRSMSKEMERIHLAKEEEKGNCDDARAMQTEAEKRRLVDQRHYEHQLEMLRNQLDIANEEISQLSGNSGTRGTKRLVHAGVSVSLRATSHMVCSAGRQRDVSQSFDLGSSSSNSNNTNLAHQQNSGVSRVRQIVRSSSASSAKSTTSSMLPSSLFSPVGCGDNVHGRVRDGGDDGDDGDDGDGCENTSNTIARLSRQTPLHHSRRPVSKSLSPKTRENVRGLSEGQMTTTTTTSNVTKADSRQQQMTSRVRFRRRSSNGKNIGNSAVYSPAAYTNTEDEEGNREASSSLQNQQPRSKSEPLLMTSSATRVVTTSLATPTLRGVNSDQNDLHTISPSSQHDFRFHPVVPEDEDDDMDCMQTLNDEITETNNEIQQEQHRHRRHQHQHQRRRPRPLDTSNSDKEKSFRMTPGSSNEDAANDSTTTSTVVVTPRAVTNIPSSFARYNTPSPSYLCPPPKLPRFTSLSSLLTNPATVTADIIGPPVVKAVTTAITAITAITASTAPTAPTATTATTATTMTTTHPPHSIIPKTPTRNHAATAASAPTSCSSLSPLAFSVDDFGLCSPRRAAGLPTFHALYAWRKIHVSSTAKTPSSGAVSSSSLSSGTLSPCLMTIVGKGGDVSSPSSTSMSASLTSSVHHQTQQSGRVWDNTSRLSIKRRRRHQGQYVSDDGLIVVYEINTLDTGGPVVKSIRARYEGDSDGMFRTIKHASCSIPLRSCPTFAGLGRSFHVFEVPLSDAAVDGALEELMLSFDKRMVSKVEQVVVLANDRRFIPLASSLPLMDEGERSLASTSTVENKNRKILEDTTTTTVTPATQRAARGGGRLRLHDPNVVFNKLSATQKEKVLEKIQSYKRSISPVS